MTPYADIDAVLAELPLQLEGALGKNFAGLYLIGSLAGGDFEYQSSDIDFVVATRVELDDRELARLRLMHDGIATKHRRWGGKLEGAYISTAALRRYVPGERHAYINEGHPLSSTPLDKSWVINRFELRDHGVAVTGPPPAELVDPISGHDLKTAMLEELRSWWRPLAEGGPKMEPRRYQAFAILTMCRALYLLEHGQIASKPKAARWADSALDAQWRPTIQRALTWRHDRTIDRAALRETLRFVGFTLEEAGRQTQNLP